MRKQSLCLAICLGLLGCEAQQPKEKTKMASGDLISKDMPLSESLAILRGKNIAFEEIETASAWPDPLEEMKEFRVAPSFDSDDVLYLVAVSQVGTEEYNVRELKWHIDWKSDSKLPKRKRANRFLELEQIDTDVLSPIKDPTASNIPSDRDLDPFGEEP